MGNTGRKRLRRNTARSAHNSDDGAALFLSTADEVASELEDDIDGDAEDEEDGTGGADDSSDESASGEACSMAVALRWAQWHCRSHARFH